MPVKTVKEECTMPRTCKEKKTTLPTTLTSEPSGVKTIPKGLSDKANRALRDLVWIEGQDSPKVLQVQMFLVVGSL